MITAESLQAGQRTLCRIPVSVGRTSIVPMRAARRWHTGCGANLTPQKCVGSARSVTTGTELESTNRSLSSEARAPHSQYAGRIGNAATALPLALIHLQYFQVLHALWNRPRVVSSRDWPDDPGLPDAHRGTISAVLCLQCRLLRKRYLQPSVNMDEAIHALPRQQKFEVFEF